MNIYSRTYIALGSNIHNRETHLNYAIHQIFKTVGSIISVSKVYKTPAFGFDGDYFYNACIEVDTIFSAPQLLKQLKTIEEQIGRKKTTQGYEDRPIDLDILFFENNILNNETLTIPHKHLHTRDFVLLPLNDLCPEFVHPILNKSINQLTSELPKTEIEAVDVELNLPKLIQSELRYICIEGNIGAGKTTFSKMFSHDYKAKLILERFKDNPFLPQFYKDPKRFAFPTEMSFLADRHQQLVDDIAQLDLFSSLCVSDYDLFKSLIFAEITLQPDEFQLYKKIFNIIYKEIPKPDLYIYFYQNTSRLLENIKKRGRDYEQNISAEYLDKINAGYLNFIKQQTKFKTIIIDVSDKNFVDNREDYLSIIEEILN